MMSQVMGFHAEGCQVRWVSRDAQSLRRLSLFESPVGPLWVLHAGGVLYAAEFGAVGGTSAQAALCGAERAPMPTGISHVLEDLFAGRPNSDWAAADTGFTELEQMLLQAAAEIPFGSTCSYSTLAHLAGFPGRARAAGRAMSRAPLAYLIPTHRIIRADGTAAECQRDPLNDDLRRFEHIELVSQGYSKRRRYSQ